MFGGKTLLLCASLIVLGLSQARATFIIDPPPIQLNTQEKVFFDSPHVAANSIPFHVGGNNTGPTGTVTTNTLVQSGSGFAEIKPIIPGTLTSVLITLDDPNQFSAFSFRGQLGILALGNFTLIVENQFGIFQTFAFSGLGANDDFGRHGIVSIDGQTIASIEMISNFREVKLLAFGFGQAAVPDGGSVVALFGMGLMTLEFLRRKVLC